MIMAGGSGERLSILAAERVKPAIPFAGEYRIIDFTLSNCVNSGITNVAILTQYNPRSLVQHLGIGKPWDLDRTGTSFTILQPYFGRTRQVWYYGTADSIYQNLYYVEESGADEVLILAGDHIYTMRYEEMLAVHHRNNADITVSVLEVPREEAPRFGTVLLDSSDRITGFEEKVKEPKSNLASMGIYIFNRQVLTDCLEEDSCLSDSKHDFGADILPRNIDKYKTFAYRFNGYWRDVGTVEAYWKTNMDLIIELPEFNLYDPKTPIHTRWVNVPPAKMGPHAHVKRSLISAGCIINGSIINSVLSPGVYVEVGGQVIDSIIFNDSTVDRDSIVHRSITDKQVRVNPGAHIGFGDDYTANAEEPDRLNTGITLVGKGAKIPQGIKIGRNCKINSRVEPSDYNSDFVPSGTSIQPKKGRRYGI